LNINELTTSDIEQMLNTICAELTAQCQKQKVFSSSRHFEESVRDSFQKQLANIESDFTLTVVNQAFPDIAFSRYGVEVKFSEKDTWRSIANSVFEGSRNEEVEAIFVVFGKMGGIPEVRWNRYEDCIIHVRTSHVPRFELEIGATNNLFSQLSTTYDEFRRLNIHDRMEKIRKYARSRLKAGERLWWLEDADKSPHSLPLQVRIYTALSPEEKRRLRAQASLLCPEIVKPSHAKHKYDNATLFLLTYHGVLCNQARDLFTAGSVGQPKSDSPNSSIRLYILHALKDIETEMRMQADLLDDQLYVEYWGRSVPPDQRITEWLKQADQYAEGWLPSDHLFKNTN
jgi:hypothetical protein